MTSSGDIAGVSGSSHHDPVDTTPRLGYHDFWWILDDGLGSYMASGIHGQRLYVCPGRELVRTAQ